LTTESAAIIEAIDRAARTGFSAVESIAVTLYAPQTICLHE